MDLYRIRLEVPDGPGRIGRALVALGDLAVPVECADRNVAILLARDASRFTRTETARLRALLDVAFQPARREVRSR